MFTPRYLAFYVFYSVFMCVGMAQSALLFEDDFENSSFGSKGWYAGNGGILSTTEHIPGSSSSFECKFLQGGTVCSSGTPGRHIFTATDSVYMSYYVKCSSNWQGSNRPYHPHEFLILTTVDGPYLGPSRTHLTAYVEQNEGTPRLAITDALNIDITRIGQDLVNVTELRGISGCNGDSDGYGAGECYVGSFNNRYNGKIWNASNSYFQDLPGTFYKNSWHFVEAYFKLNSIVNNKGLADGVMKYWHDGTLLIDHSNVMFRTGQHPTMQFNQFIVAPWIGDGSPIEQTMWIDNLAVMTSRPADANNTPPAAPHNLRIQ